jgi:hypothetical protein
MSEGKWPGRRAAFSCLSPTRSRNDSHHDSIETQIPCRSGFSHRSRLPLTIAILKDLLVLKPTLDTCLLVQVRFRRFDLATSLTIDQGRREHRGEKVSGQRSATTLRRRPAPWPRRDRV